MDRNALTVIDGDARIACRRLAEVLGFARIDVLHRLIRAREEELRGFGEVFHFEAENPSKKGGRPIKGYYLNEHQATALCLWAETDKARSARKLIVEVFTAWRKGELDGEFSASKWKTPADPFAAMAGRARDAADHLAALEAIDDLALRVTHLPIWSNGRRPRWWGNLDLRRMVTVAHRQMTLAACCAAARARFGADAPSVSGLQRYWAQLDRVQGPSLVSLPRPSDLEWPRDIARPAAKRRVA